MKLESFFQLLTAKELYCAEAVLFCIPESGWEDGGIARYSGAGR
jgi:hypothetical protein